MRPCAATAGGIILLALTWLAWTRHLLVWVSLILKLVPVGIFAGASLVMVTRVIGEPDIPRFWRIATVLTLGVCGPICISSLLIGEAIIEYWNGQPALVAGWLGIVTGALWSIGIFVYVGAEIARKFHRNHAY